MSSTGHLNPYSDTYLLQTAAYSESVVLWVCAKQVRSEVSTLGTSALRQTRELLGKFSHHILPIQRTETRLTSERLRTSAVTGHVLEPYGSKELTTAVHTGPLIDPRMSSRRDR